MKRFRHILLFKLHADLTEDSVEKATSLLRILGQNNSEILEWKIEPSLDRRKGLVIVQNSLFVDKDAFERFRISDKHKTTAEHMSRISDWIIGDYYDS